MVRKQKKQYGWHKVKKTNQCQRKAVRDTLETLALSAVKKWVFSRESPKLIIEHGRPPTTISLRESKAASSHKHMARRKKNTAPANAG